MNDGQDATRKIADSIANSSDKLARDGLCMACGKVYKVRPGEKPYCSKDGNALTPLPILDEPLVGHYVYKGLLGVGGMGVVYKALNSYLDKIVAIKTLKGKRYNEKELLRFQQEGKLLAKLVHPNLVSVMDFGVNQAQEPYMVLEYLQGESLAEMLKEEGILDLDLALDLTKQAAAGLAHAHSFGAVHRDIKPGNIFVTKSREGPLVKVFDFGIAKLFFMDDPGARADLTKTGEIFGSPLYMSPEQALGKSLDERSDLYSLGCVLYEMLVGKPPIVGQSAMETIFKHVSETPLRLAVACPTLKYPPAVQQLLDLLLAKERDDRLQSADQLVRLLQAIMDENKTGLAELNSLSTTVKRRLGQQGQSDNAPATRAANDKKLIVAAVLAGVITAGGIAAFLLQDKAPNSLAKTKALSTAGNTAEGKDKAVTPLAAQEHPIYNEAPSELGLIDQVMNPSDQSRLTLIEHELKKGKESLKLPRGNKLKKPDFVAIAKAGQSLKKLEIEGCSGLDADSLRELQALPISEVYVKWGDIDDGGMAAIFKMAGLRNLSIIGCSYLTPKVFSTLGNAKRLFSLQMENGQVDGRFFAKEPPTEWLTELSFTGMRAFNSNHKAKIVNTDLITQRLSSCSQLKNLVLEGSDISDAGIKWLTKLPHLEQLTVTRGKISDVSIPLFLQIKSLRDLDLSGTKVSPSGLERLLKLSKIKTVAISPDGQFSHLTPYLREQMNIGRLLIH
jgi:serine/threonine protein kinase